MSALSWQNSTNRFSSQMPGGPAGDSMIWIERFIIPAAVNLQGKCALGPRQPFVIQSAGRFLKWNVRCHSNYAGHAYSRAATHFDFLVECKVLRTRLVSQSRIKRLVSHTVCTSSPFVSMQTVVGLRTKPRTNQATLETQRLDPQAFAFTPVIIKLYKESEGNCAGDIGLTWVPNSVPSLWKYLTPHTIVLI